jgi:DNA-binding MarR family transcriptional regulator
MKRTVREEIQQQRPFPSLEEEVYVNLRLTAQVMDQPWFRYLRRTEAISPSQYNILRILRGAGEAGRTMSEAAERMINRDPDVTRLGDQLVRRGLARRVRDPEDRRVVRLVITPAGLAMLGRLDPAVDAFMQQALGACGRKRLVQLRDLLDTVRSLMRPFPAAAEKPAA